MSANPVYVKIANRNRWTVYAWMSELVGPTSIGSNLVWANKVMSKDFTTREKLFLESTPEVELFIWRGSGCELGSCTTEQYQNEFELINGAKASGELQPLMNKRPVAPIEILHFIPDGVDSGGNCRGFEIEIWTPEKPPIGVGDLICVGEWIGGAMLLTHRINCEAMCMGVSRVHRESIIQEVWKLRFNLLGAMLAVADNRTEKNRKIVSAVHKRAVDLSADVQEKQKKKFDLSVERHISLDDDE